MVFYTLARVATYERLVFLAFTNCMRLSREAKCCKRATSALTGEFTAIALLRQLQLVSSSQTPSVIAESSALLREEANNIVLEPDAPEHVASLLGSRNRLFTASMSQNVVL
jgi:hypothetical protein